MSALLEQGISHEFLGTTPEGVWIFPAQGDLKPGIGKDEYATSPAFKALVDAADTILGGERKFSETMFDDPDGALASPPNAHLALTIVTLAKLEMGVEQGKITAAPTSIISNSAGEVAALYAAGVTKTLEQTLRIAKKRGELTEEASKGHDVLMTTLIASNASSNILEKAQMVVDALNGREQQEGDGKDTVAISGINSPISIGLTGDRRLVEEAKAHLKDVSRRQGDMDMIKIASHCGIMDEAAEKFAEFLDGEELSEPWVTLNMNGVMASALGEVKGRLKNGLKEPVNFVASVGNVTENGQEPTIYELSTRQMDPVKGEIPSVWGRFANDTLKGQEKELKVVVI